MLTGECGIFSLKERISMSYKFDSLITILKKLDQRETVTVHSLMNDLEISERTTYRYILTLETAGFPIIYDRKKQSYIFSDNYKAPFGTLPILIDNKFPDRHNVTNGNCHIRL
jgi:hypothetical protein